MPRVDTVVRGGSIVTAWGIINAGLAVDHGTIVSMASEANLPSADKVIRADGLLIMPGCIDAFVHMREPGFEQKEDYSSGTKAAAAGGVTFIIDDSMRKPPTQTVEAFESKRKLAEGKSIIDFGLSVGMNSSNYVHAPEFSKLGAISFEVFTGGVAEDYVLTDLGILREVLRAVAAVDGLVSVYPQMQDILTLAAKELRDVGRIDLRAHSESRPEVSEACGIALLALLAREAGASMHIRQLSCGLAVDLMHLVKKHINPRITAEVAPHHLLLTAQDFETRLGSRGKVNPPLRTAQDVERLWTGLRDGTIDLIAGDHAPHRLSEKEMGSHGIWDALPGFPALETTLRLILTEAKRGRLELHELVRYLSENPARVFGVYPRKGSLAVGGDADMVLVDMKHESAITSDGLYTKAGWTPWEGWMAVKGPKLTMLRGEVVMEDGEVIGKLGFGKFIAPFSMGMRAPS